ncbi:MAG: hypothetical protein E7448_02840 [Ruminococcaceae bacterium]|nr:hypothetical protein [Oscillospiraceae bacterium]
MEGIYPILHGDQPVGQARVTRRGLYYHFLCRLQMTGKAICRLEVTCGDITENLGIPVPEGGAFVLNKALPVSRFEAGKPTIRVVPKHSELRETFVPISPEEPFAYLSRLKNAYLQHRGQQIGIVIRE